MAKATVANLDWNHLGFEYHDLPYSFNEEFKDGQWQGGTLTESSTLTLLGSRRSTPLRPGGF